MELGSFKVIDLLINGEGVFSLVSGLDPQQPAAGGCLVGSQVPVPLGTRVGIRRFWQQPA